MTRLSIKYHLALKVLCNVVPTHFSNLIFYYSPLLLQSNTERSSTLSPVLWVTTHAVCPGQFQFVLLLRYNYYYNY